MEKMMILTALFALFTHPLHAEDLVPDSADDLKAKSEVKMGWTKKATLGANISLSSSDKFIGSQDGDTKTYGINIDSSFDYKKGQHESRTSIKLSEAQSSAPPLNRFIKSTDELALTSTYLYTLKNTPWLGPYARVKLQTSILKSEHVQDRDAAIAYSVTYVDSSRTCTTCNDSTFKLADAFKPMTTRESVGFFAKAIDKKEHKLLFRLGFGALQVNASDVFALADDATTTNQIEIKELESYSQAGIEFGIDWSYALDGKTSLSAGLDTLTPSGTLAKDHAVCQGCSGTERTDIDANFKLTSKVYEWMSVSYELKFKRQPELQKADQEQHLVLLNFTQTLL